MEKSVKRPLPPELLEEVRRLHFQTRRLADQGIVGRYRSAFRGQGIEFEEVREYSPGDDIRLIDWKVTARARKPFVRTYREERELTVIIAVDVSASTFSATAAQTRESLIAKIGAFLTLIALRNNDKVGLVTFSDRLETFHPPRKARGAVWRILHEVLNERHYRHPTDLSALFAFLSAVLKRRAIVFVLSDFIDRDFEPELSHLARRHDVNTIIISDPSDYELPDAGLVELLDPESEACLTVDSSDPAVRTEYKQLAASRIRELERLFIRHGVGYMELFTDRPFISAFRRYFNAKSRHWQRRVYSAPRPM